ncbi:phage gp6-like head-tail connector protein [Nonomuraea turkmeniaca]|uniref:Phage gp6-like head-tail connector protein n=1 Tax=Nonomuraea turkmeniaca TaxID=103838 RepID=A0A5S4FQW7_9ACTN|nr:head-tail connector protein [Nonomuraea turkmeniaca]TMR11748.1 phage gp6-like head-tail connector protein [Nonomuraea turkmeniaca]
MGAVVRLSTSVRDSAGVLVNPASIQVTIQLPDATTVGPFTPTNDGVGLYHYDYLTAMAGRHIARWATITPTSNDEEPFEVAPMWGEAGILSLGEAKQQLNIDATDTADDEEIQGFIRSVTAICERYVGALGRTTYTEKHRGGYMLALNRAPVLSVTSVVAIETGGVDQAVADLDVDLPTGIVQRKDSAKMCGPFRVTYLAGRTNIPPNVRQAALLLLQFMWETQRGQIGVRVGGSDADYDPRVGFTLPRRVIELLGEQAPGIA